MILLLAACGSNKTLGTKTWQSYDLNAYGLPVEVYGPEGLAFNMDSIPGAVQFLKAIDPATGFCIGVYEPDTLIANGLLAGRKSMQQAQTEFVRFVSSDESGFIAECKWPSGRTDYTLYKIHAINGRQFYIVCRDLPDADKARELYGLL